MQGWNVSATHSIIGGIIGFAMAWGGPGSVLWAEPDPTKIPPIKGVVPIILSWFVSPILTAIASAVIYGINVFCVLKSEHSLSRSFYVLPLLIFATIMIDIYFVFTKGAKKSLASEDDWSDAKAAWISAIIGLGCAVLGSIVGIPYLKYKLRLRLQAAKELEDAATLNEVTTNADEKARLELLVSIA
jgi:sodium-dependent phosphate transporter